MFLVAVMRKASGGGSSLFCSVFSVFSFLYLKTNRLCFSIFPLFFLSISAPFSSLSPRIYKEERGGERATTPVQSWHRGRVAGRPLGAALGQPEKLVPSALWSWQVRGVGFVRVWTSGREGERENAGEKISSSLASACVGKKENNAVQDSTVLVSFFFLLLRG